MSLIEINTIDDLVVALTKLYDHSNKDYCKYNYVSDFIKPNGSYCKIGDLKVDMSHFDTYMKYRHITETRFIEDDDETAELADIIIQVQIAAAPLLLDETYNATKKAKEKLAKIGYTVFKSDLPEFGDNVLLNKNFRLYFDN